ncbi:MAG: hypothetical protein R6U27_13035 [Desulfobacterales bacterium]
MFDYLTAYNVVVFRIEFFRIIVKNGVIQFNVVILVTKQLAYDGTCAGSEIESRVFSRKSFFNRIHNRPDKFLVIGIIDIIVMKLISLFCFFISWKMLRVHLYRKAIFTSVISSLSKLTKNFGIEAA